MPRTTKEDIYQIERVINGMLERKGYNIRVHVEWAYGQPRAHYSHIGNDGRHDLSPRLPMGEMYRWLCAFEAGLNIGLMDHTVNMPVNRLPEKEN